eukprot:Skav202395  [mRNA]  locus=scaffold815:128002:128909:- [translate_table: standard]
MEIWRVWKCKDSTDMAQCLAFPMHLILVSIVESLGVFGRTSFGFRGPRSGDLGLPWSMETIRNLALDEDEVLSVEDSETNSVDDVARDVARDARDEEVDESIEREAAEGCRGPWGGHGGAVPWCHGGKAWLGVGRSLGL